MHTMPRSARTIAPASSLRSPAQGLRKLTVEPGSLPDILDQQHSKNSLICCCLIYFQVKEPLRRSEQAQCTSKGVAGVHGGSKAYTDEAMLKLLSKKGQALWSVSRTCVFVVGDCSRETHSAGASAGCADCQGCHIHDGPQHLGFCHPWISHQQAVDITPDVCAIGQISFSS